MIKKWVTISIVILVGLLMVIVLYKGGVTITSMISDKINDDFVSDSTDDYNCVNNIYDCPDFKFQEDAQRVFELCGGVENDVHHLDGDSDGWACEVLESEPENSAGVGGFGFY